MDAFRSRMRAAVRARKEEEAAALAIDEARPEGMMDMLWNAGKNILKKGVVKATETAVKTALEALVPGSSSSVVVKTRTPAEIAAANKAKAEQAKKNPSKSDGGKKKEVVKPGPEPRKTEPSKESQAKGQITKPAAKDPPTPDKKVLVLTEQTKPTVPPTSPIDPSFPN